MFELHPRLADDTYPIGNFPLSSLLLLDDANYPWFILVPRRTDIREIYQLTEADQGQLLKESSHLAEVLATHFHADKINIAALGNMVPQLHIHHIVRYRTDPAWPGTVWGHRPPRHYTAQEKDDLCQALVPQLQQFTPASSF